MTEACVARLVYRSTVKSSWQARHDSTGEWHRWRTKARTGEADLLLPELERRPLHAREEDLLVGLQHGSKLLQAGLGVGRRASWQTLAEVRASRISNRKIGVPATLSF